MSDPRAAVVPGDEEGLEAEPRHGFELVPGHGAEGVIRVVGQSARLAAVAVAPQIGRDHGEILREPGRHLVPHDVRRRIANGARAAAARCRPCAG